MTKSSQDNNGIMISTISILFKHFYEYLTKKLKYRDLTCIISDLLTS